MKEQPVTQEMLRKYLRGSCTAEELEQVEHFLAQPGNTDVLHRIIAEESDALWQLPASAHGISPERVGEWQQKVSRRIAAESSKPDFGHGPRYFFLRYAAALLLGLGVLSFVFYRMKQPKHPTAIAIAQREVATPEGRRAKIILPDSTVVHLGAGSRLAYAERFPADKREIILEGEAFFDVKTDHARPFLVRTDHVTTRVLGTSFKVDAFRGERMQVSVATGKVRVSYQQDSLSANRELAVLKPGRQVQWDEKAKTAKTSEVRVDDLLGWQRGQLAFVKKPITEVLATLGRWYNVDISLNNKRAAAYEVTIFIDGTKSIRQTLDVLAENLNLEYTITGRNIHMN